MIKIGEVYSQKNLPPSGEAYQNIPDTGDVSEQGQVYSTGTVFGPLMRLMFESRPNLIASLIKEMTICE